MCPQMSWGLQLWSMALGPAGLSFPHAHAHVVEVSLIAHGNATTLGNKRDASSCHTLTKLKTLCIQYTVTVAAVLLKYLSFFRPAFGGNECVGVDIQAELCHQQVCFLLMFTMGLLTVGQYHLHSGSLYPH